MSLRTRKPTGAVAYPLLLVEGPEKSGKTFTALWLIAGGDVNPNRQAETRAYRQSKARR